MPRFCSGSDAAFLGRLVEMSGWFNGSHGVCSQPEGVRLTEARQFVYDSESFDGQNFKLKEGGC